MTNLEPFIRKFLTRSLRGEKVKGEKKPKKRKEEERERERRGGEKEMAQVMTPPTGPPAEIAVKVYTSVGVYTYKKRRTSAQCARRAVCIINRNFIRSIE